MSHCLQSPLKLLDQIQEDLMYADHVSSVLAVCQASFTCLGVRYCTNERSNSSSLNLDFRGVQVQEVFRFEIQESLGEAFSSPLS